VRSASLDRALRLIVITDRELAAPSYPIDVARAALAAGARAIQLRDKRAPSRDLLEQARRLRELTHAHDALLFVNDRLDVALASRADGVHLGPTDLTVADVRAVAPKGFIIGASTDDPFEARAATEAGADYIGCGTVYPTRSKADAGRVIGLDGLRRVVDAVDVPVVGIGGIGPEQAREVAGTGAAGIAVIGAVMSASHPGRVVAALLEPWGGAHETTSVGKPG
jgi:thiamine-phosphate diphosphorylase